MPNPNLSVACEQFIPLLPYYVYTLVDPRTNEVFYVGKGKGERALDHVAQVRQLVRSGTALVSEKHRRIKAILDDGFEGGPHARVIARFEDEKQAHAVESVLINFSYDFERQLTNAVRGHGAEFVRRFGDASELPGIDVPQRVRAHDGSFANEKIASLRAAGAYEFKARIEDELARRGFAVRGFTRGTTDRPYDPGESNGFLGTLVHIEGIDFLVGFSHKCKPGISIANTPATRTPAVRARMALIAQTLNANAYVRWANSPHQGEPKYGDFWRTLADGKRERLKPVFEPDDLEGLYGTLEGFRRLLTTSSEPKAA